MKRTEQELLTVVYRRSSQIRRRRWAVRSIAAGLVMSLGIGLPLILRSAHLPLAPVPSQEAAPPPSVIAQLPPPATRPSPSACACSVSPGTLGSSGPTLAKQLSSGHFVPGSAPASTPFAFASDRSGNW